MKKRNELSSSGQPRPQVVWCQPTCEKNTVEGGSHLDNTVGAVPLGPKGAE